MICFIFLKASTITTEDPKFQSQPQDSSKIFQCKISSQSYPYIEVFYNCYAPPVLPAAATQSLLTPNLQQSHGLKQQQQQQQPVILLYQTPQQIQQQSLQQQQHQQLLSSKSSSTSSSPVHFYHSAGTPQQMLDSGSYSSSPSTTATTQLTYMVPKFYVKQDKLVEQ